jgi:hypothetical protein
MVDYGHSKFDSGAEAADITCKSAPCAGAQDRVDHQGLHGHGGLSVARRHDRFAKVFLSAAPTPIRR